MISIYVHIPFCLQKCGYCDFHSVAMPVHEVPQDEYTAAVCEELIRLSAKYQLSGKKVGSVYFGGGTPTMFAVRNIETILNSIYKNFLSAESVEVTLEANPETFKPIKAPNRISIGIQTFNDRHLKTLGRIHSAETARQAVRSAQAGGCKNVSIDLMWGLPNQTLEELKSDLNSAIELNVQHISAYQLTLNDKVGEGLRPLPNMAGTETRHYEYLPSDERAVEMFWLVHDMLTSAGFEHYEISNFARLSNKNLNTPTLKHSNTFFRSFHNENYWHYGEWLGLGSGATSFLWGTSKNHPSASLSTSSQSSRTKKYAPVARLLTPSIWALFRGSRITCSKDIAKYLKHDFVYETEIIDQKTAMAEYSFLGLRTSSGIDLGDFQKRFGQNFDEIYPTLRNKWISRQLAIATSNGFALNPDGWLISDELFQKFV